MSGTVPGKAGTMKTKVTVEWAKAQANELVAIYPHLTNATDVMNQAIRDGKYQDKREYLAVWGRVMRLFR
jgi:hypothetical protein